MTSSLCLKVLICRLTKRCLKKWLNFPNLVEKACVEINLGQRLVDAVNAYSKHHFQAILMTMSYQS